MTPDVDRAAAGLVGVGFAGPAVDDELARLLARGVRVVILFARNAGTPSEVRALCRAVREAAPHPVTICVDQEGGSVQRLTDGFTAQPSARAAAAEGVEAVAALGASLGAELADVGIDLDCAPVVDVDTNPENPVIGARSFSAHPEEVARLGRAFIEALQAAGVAACAKHFPGHGDTDLDSHHDLPVVRHDLDRLRRVELVPFVEAISARVKSVMIAHLMVPAIDATWPASLSRRVVTDLLRGELGYDGVVISDDLEMKAIADRYAIGAAAAQSIAAGCDLVLCCHEPPRMQAAVDGIARAIEDGVIPMDAVRAAHARLDGL